MDKADQILEYALEWLKTTEEFVVSETPLVVAEFYRWEYGINITGFLIGLSLLGLTYYLYSVGKTKGWWIVKKGYNKGSLQPYIMFLALPISVGIITILDSGYNLLFLILAPRLYLIDKISNLF